MKLIWPILKREYMTRITTKAFWISTALFPLLAFAFTVGPNLLMSRSKASAEPIKIVDAVGDFFPVLEKSLAHARLTATPDVIAEPLRGRSTEQFQSDLNREANQGKIQGFLVVDAKSIENNSFTFYARNPSSMLSNDWFRASVREAANRYRLIKLGVPEEKVERGVSRVDFDVQKSGAPGEKQSGETAFFMSLALVMFIYISLIFYGVYVLRGVLEEKSNRIVEVIVSSVKPFHLMMGKIVGIGLVGLTQIAIWSIFSLVISTPQLAMAFSMTRESIPSISTPVLVFFPVYFVLGYFLYSTIYAGIGSMFNSDEDAQQMAGIANIFLILPMMLLMVVFKNPGGNLAVALSLVPFFSPILMYLRIAIQMPPAWQIALSLVIMIVTIVAMIWLVSRIYRVGILMYGKKPTLPEVARWLRYS